MKKIKEMINSAFSKADAMQILLTWRIVGSITESEYIKGRELIKKEFS
jgi:hypothetical protein